MRQILLTTWAASAAIGCNYHGGGMTTGQTESAATADTEATTSETAGEATSTVSETGSATGATTDPAVSYCHGFQTVASAPFLSLYILGGEMLVDGASWPIECGSDRKWMFGLYPSLGGWDPMTNDLMFEVEVDVEGFNLDPAGHFFSAEVDYHIGCEDPWAGLLGVAPVSLPAGVSDPAELDGKPATIHVTVLAGDMELTADAAVTLSAPRDVVLQGCSSP